MYMYMYLYIIYMYKLAHCVSTIVSRLNTSQYYSPHEHLPKIYNVI